MPASWPGCCPSRLAAPNNETPLLHRNLKPESRSSIMAKGIFRELVTINGKNVVLAHKEPPVINAGVLENADIFRMINIFAEKFSPTNIDKADGTPLRLYTSARAKIDVSNRRKHDMRFGHRNTAAHHIICRVKGRPTRDAA